MSSDAFNSNVTKLRLKLVNNVQKVLCRYLLPFLRKADNKVFHKKGGNYVIGCGSGRGPQGRIAFVCPMSCTKYLFDIL